eukprot:2878585-Amphidinium_carterae.1
MFPGAGHKLAVRADMMHELNLARSSNDHYSNRVLTIVSSFAMGLEDHHHDSSMSWNSSQKYDAPNP